MGIETMATGWAAEGAVLDQIRDRITNGVQSARSRLPQGQGTVDCVECGEAIPVRRRAALLGVTTCVGCQPGRDRQLVHLMVNRRGSKDSQLK
jgi:RNA polymerase-binding transcription factor DksA